MDEDVSRVFDLVTGSVNRDEKFTSLEQWTRTGSLSSLERQYYTARRQ